MSSSSSSPSFLSLYCRNLAPPYLEIRVLLQTQPFKLAPFGSPLSSLTSSPVHQVQFHQICIHQHIPLLTQCPLQLHIRNETSVEGGEEEEDSQKTIWKCTVKKPLRFDSSEKGTSDCWADSIISMVEADYVVPHSKKRTQKNDLDIGRWRRTPCKGRVKKRHVKLTFIILLT